MSKKSEQQARVVLAIDPAAKAGVALFYEGKLIGTTAANGAKWRPLVVAIGGLLSQLPSDAGAQPRHVVIEDGWLRPGWGAKGALTLGRRRGLAMAAAEAMGFEHDPTFVGPSTWQGKLFGRLKLDESKQKALAFVAEHYAKTDISEDEADAICIGHYWLTYEQGPHTKSA